MSTQNLRSHPPMFHAPLLVQYTGQEAPACCSPWLRAPQLQKRRKPCCRGVALLAVCRPLTRAMQLLRYKVFQQPCGFAHQPDHSTAQRLPQHAHRAFTAQHLHETQEKRARNAQHRHCMPAQCSHVQQVSFSSCDCDQECKRNRHTSRFAKAPMDFVAGSLPICMPF